MWWHEIAAKVPADCKPEPMGAEDPLFILYTSGSTGKPKGVLHTTGGYIVFASMTHQYVFDYHDGDIYWCTADVGWVTGHSYIVYGPLANGATTLMFEGVPNYPDSSRFWQVIDKHKVNIFYTAPTAIRALMREGEAPVKKATRKSLRLLGSVGEPINPEAWLWYYRVVGDSRCPIVDTWWQTETGGILITPLPGATKLKPGSATKPFFGVQPVMVDAEGKELQGAVSGNLCLINSWPGQMRTVYGDHQRFIETYFKTYPGKYFTGDGARRDADGYYWITGRVDDVINVSGHRIGTAEVESALVGNVKVAEAAVVGYPHDIKGQGIYAYVTLKAGQQSSEDLRKELVAWVRKEIGPIATPDVIQWAPGLPKTRSGKIMRRILRKIAENDFSNLGDTSTLADPAVVDDLVKNRSKVNPTIQQLAADLAAGRTTSRKLTEQALARIADPKGEGRRAFIKVWRDQALAAADASDGQRKAGLVPSPLAGLPVSIKNLCDVAGETTLVGLQGARRCAAGQGRCARGGAAARGRRGDRRQHQHERVRLLGRGLQPALRHAGQSGRPQARARRLLGRRRRLGGRRHGRGGARHRHRRLGAHSRRRLRHHRLQADGAARADRRRGAALDLARFDRAAGQFGRMLRHRRRGVRRRADHRSLRRRRSAGPALRRAHALRDGRSRSRGRQGLRAGAEGAVGRRREGREDRPAGAERAATRSTPGARSPPPRPMPGTAR